MRFAFSVLLFFFQTTSFASEKITIEFSNGTVDLYADITTSGSDEGFHVEDVSIKIPDQSHGSLYLVAEFGWGDSPYDKICKQISKIRYGEDTYKYASAYGYATTFSVFSGIISKVEFFVVNLDGSFSLSDTYPNSVYDSGFSCYAENWEY